mgnify:CR=1 FL=1
MKCCEQYAAALSAFVDGELSENEKEEVLSHVEHCQNCREYLSELMIVHTMFEEMPELDAPEGFSERVLERVHEEKRARSRHRRAWPRVLAACFALVVISAAALKILPAMASKSDSAANETADNGSAMDNTVGGAANDGYSYTYAAVQKDSALADEDFLYEGVPENSTADHSADADDDYTVITLDLPEAADFLREHGMAVYVEAEDSVSYLVVPETAHELSEALPLDEEEKAALAAAEELVIVEVAKAEEAPAENNAAEEEGNT